MNMGAASKKWGPYWNPVLETLPHEKIRRLQLEKFKKIFAWAYERSRFHRGAL